MFTIAKNFCCIFFIGLVICQSTCLFAQLENIRETTTINKQWVSVVSDSLDSKYEKFYSKSFNAQKWRAVSIPHNWDQYEGYRRLRHGNKHGYAWYRKQFTLSNKSKSKQYFLLFEGVGSFATVWLNGKQVGKHAGGRTSFTLDVTSAINLNGNNLIAVRADHPAMINELPWLCGGCSDDRGWSEGSQPLGIFRPVHLVITDPVRIEPFGVHIWNDEKVSNESGTLYIKTELKNYHATQRNVLLASRLADANGKTITQVKTMVSLPKQTIITTAQAFSKVSNPHLWSLEDPYLYTVVTDVIADGKIIDQVKTPYGIRWVSWPSNASASKQFLLNGKPVFINGTCEYEHNMGKSHAFESAQIVARVKQIRAAGYNAFRDAHQPHNLLYNKLWDELGILNWTQFSAHAWYDNPTFRENFKTLITEWVKERRNSPSVVMWGLQNESKIPEAFAKECTELIRQLDPTASIQRPVTTCNGGEGTDWDVPQNWTGTYGGNPETYGTDLKRQLLVGEYGAWRSLDLHTSGPFEQNGTLSEDRMTKLMETKIRLAESVKDSVAGHFHWLFTSHENPGRVQSGEGFRELDRVGPINYKGLLTPWGEPLDAFYMYRSNYADRHSSPMVYIVSHTWPDRWLKPGLKDSIIIYSNCDEVELFNDDKSISLGKKKKGPVGTHFQWDGVPINHNILYAEGSVNGKVVAKDKVILNHLPAAPSLKKTNSTSTILMPAKGYNYLYRVNCGGKEYQDTWGNVWKADGKASNKTWGSRSWTDKFKMPAFYASQRYTNDAIAGTNDWPLFQQFRYGMDQLSFKFPVPDGSYLVELYFTEPWYGTGGGMDCNGWRLFDVAVNEKVVIKKLDIFKEVGHDAALKKTFIAQVKGGNLIIAFPNVAVGQAIISAIAIASLKSGLNKAPDPQRIISNLDGGDKLTHQSWLKTGDQVFKNDPSTFSFLPAELYGAEWIQPSNEIIKQVTNFTLSQDADVYVALKTTDQKPLSLTAFAETTKYVETDENGGTSYRLYTKRFSKNERVTIEYNDQIPLMFANAVSAIEPPYDLKPSVRYEAEKATLKGVRQAKDSFAGKAYVAYQKTIGDAIEWAFAPGVADMHSLHFRYINNSGKPLSMQMQLLAADGTIMKEEELEFTPTTTKWATVSTNTGSYINAGNYKIILSSKQPISLGIDYLEIQ